MNQPDPLAGVTVPAEALRDPELQAFIDDGVWEAREVLSSLHRGTLASLPTPVIAAEACAQADRLLGRWDLRRMHGMMKRLGLDPRQQEFIIRRSDQLLLA